MNRQKKLQDPTEAAISAIEEALRLDQPVVADEAAPEPRLPAATQTDLRLDLPKLEPAAEPAPPAPARTGCR